MDPLTVSRHSRLTNGFEYADRCILCVYVGHSPVDMHQRHQYHQTGKRYSRDRSKKSRKWRQWSLHNKRHRDCGFLRSPMWFRLLGKIPRNSMWLIRGSVPLGTIVSDIKLIIHPPPTSEPLSTRLRLVTPVFNMSHALMTLLSASTSFWAVVGPFPVKPSQVNPSC